MIILDVFASDLDMMNEAVLQYRLRPRDALHYAARQRVNCLDFASYDQHFDCIPGLRHYTI